MKAEDIVMTKSEIKEALVKSDCPEILIERIGEDLLLWWKTGWLQEILLVQKQAGIKEVVEWIKERVFDINAPIPVGNSIYARFREPILQAELKAKLKEWE